MSTAEDIRLYKQATAGMKAAREPLLSQTQRTLANSTELGGAILETLQAQRQDLEGARSQQNVAVAELSASAILIQRAQRQILVKRATYCGIALLLLVAIIWTWWLKFGGRSSDRSHDSRL